MALFEHEAKELFHVSTGLFYSQTPLFRPIALWRESSNQGQCAGLKQRYSVIDFTAAGGVAAARGTAGPLPPSNQRARGKRLKVKPVSHPSWWIGLYWISLHDTLHLRGRPQGGVTQQVNMASCCGWARKQTQLSTLTPHLLQEFRL